MASKLPDSPVWLITGCSTGFGRALAEQVLARGHRCVVTARNPAQVEAIAAPCPDRALVAVLDVTDAGSRERAVADALARFGRIDILVNNAGHGYNAAIEEGEEEPIRRMFEANVFGLAAMMRLVLPIMRAQGFGHMVNITSVGGLAGNPGTGYYCATKFAVEGMSQSLHAEAAHLGIRVTIVEPGPFRTDFQGRSMTVPAKTIDAYAETAGMRRKQLRESDGKQAGDPVRAADAIIRAVECDDPPLHLVLGKMAITRAREVHRKRLATFDAWEAVSLGADFPQ